MGEYYLVEGDISIPKENMDGYKKMISADQSPVTRQAYANSIISRDNVSDIKVKIDPVLANNYDWKEAILSAMDYYNQIEESAICMYEVLDNPDITILYGNIDAWASGEFPSGNGKPGRIIQISSISNPLSLKQKTYLIVHEMGHNLGFRHTDYLTAYPQYGYKAEGYTIYGANHIAGTPTGTVSSKDSHSVFNSSLFYGGDVVSWSSFSYYDLIAIRTLFPVPYDKWYRVSKNRPSYLNKDRYCYNKSAYFNAYPYTFTYTIRLYADGNSSGTEGIAQVKYREISGYQFFEAYAETEYNEGILTYNLFGSFINLALYPNIDELDEGEIAEQHSSGVRSLSIPLPSFY